MSFFKKMKQALGVGTVKIELELPPNVPYDSGSISGKLRLTAQDPQKIKRITIKLIEEYIKGKGGEDEEKKKYDLGKFDSVMPLDLQAGETKTIPFKLPFDMRASSNFAKSRQGGLSGAFASVLKTVGSEQVKHFVHAEVDVEGSAFHPSEKLLIEMK